MKVEDCIVAVERRSLGGCLDLAFVFARQFAGPLLKLHLMFAVPSVVLSWVLGKMFGANILLPTIAVFLFFSSLLSGAMVATIGPQVFGVPITLSAALKGLRSRFIPFMFLTAIARFFQLATGICMVFPSAIVTAYCGHLPEVMLLERTPVNQVTQRLSWLGEGGGFWRNMSSLLGLLVFWAVMTVGLFRLIDILSNLLFNAPILVGTISSGPDVWKAFQGRIIDDPTVTTVFQIALWIPYPVIRLAWFFCYLDQRIRNECWDLELQFRVESTRLEEQTG